jgi:hypothetical protein
MESDHLPPGLPSVVGPAVNGRFRNTRGCPHETAVIALGRVVWSLQRIEPSDRPS